MTPKKGTPDYDEQVESIIRTAQSALATGHELSKAVASYMKDPEISRQAISEAMRIVRNEI